ncbi:MAG TPA: wax ester/triacylglycerol synthase family O-acyltransferase [Marmoricola sp.]|nr:wax ester/triacylglycerol synthase family O-acyltransferase [Marmoricola sp.]
MIAPMDVTAQGFMIAESRNTPMHVGGLQLFDLPDGAGPDWSRETFESFLEHDDVAPLYLKRPTRSLALGGAWGWKPDEQFDLEYHVRHSALPAPGRIRELLELCGRLHGTRLARERPLWEMHFIEGLEDGRFAVYSKLHHALVDGVAAMRLLQATLSFDPDDHDAPPPWASRQASRKIEKEQAAFAERLLELPLGAVRSAMAISAEAAGLPGALVRTLNRGLRNETAPIALYAPKTILNRQITGARRFAAQDWPIDRIKRIGRSTGTTINDVVLAMCSGALRHYLLELDALPGPSLVAMVPVSLKLRDAAVASAAGGNAVGTIMVRLGTDLADPGDRLQSIHDSVTGGKRALAGMTQTQFVAMSGLGMAPVVLAPMLRVQGVTRPPFNLVISNVPGPRKPLYMNGARLSGMYPLSVPYHGQAVNITCTSYDGNLNFGITGCRRTAPRLQRLLAHLDDELTALEKAADLP